MKRRLMTRILSIVLSAGMAFSMAAPAAAADDPSRKAYETSAESSTVGASSESSAESSESSASSSNEESASSESSESAKESTADHIEDAEKVSESTAESVDSNNAETEETESAEEKVPDEKLDFSSGRLLVGTSDKKVIRKDDTVLSDYDGVYLLQFSDADAAKKAYNYYEARADFVDADAAAVKTASKEDTKDFEETEDKEKKDTEDTGNAEDITDVKDASQITKESNPISELDKALEDGEIKQAEKDKQNNNATGKVVALIDTGASINTNVTEAVSMLGDDASDDNGHGTDMAQYIALQNNNVRILSIKALDKNGNGTVSSIYAAIKYAIERKVDIINLSFSGYKSAEKSAILDILKEASNAGITIVGAAGNSGIDAKYTIPGSMDEAVIAGACGQENTKLDMSNFGDSVDYYVKADSTSAASAIIAGKLSAGKKLDDDPGIVSNSSVVIKKAKYEKNGLAKKYEQVTDKSVTVKYLLVDSAVYEDNESIDTVWERYPVIICGQMEDNNVPVYKTPTGYIFSAESPLVNGLADGDYTDAVFARSNFDGEVIKDGVKFDKHTGLATVTDEAMKGKDGDDYSDISLQVLLPINEEKCKTQYEVSLADTRGVIDYRKVESRWYANTDVEILAEKRENLTKDDFTVYLNGDSRPMDPDDYTYNRETGVLDIGRRTGAVSSVYIKLDKEANGMLQTAYSHHWSRTADVPRFQVDASVRLSVGQICNVSAHVVTYKSAHDPVVVPSYPGADSWYVESLGYIDVPQNLFGQNFGGYQLYCWCAHLSHPLDRNPRNGTRTVNFRVHDAWTDADGTRHYAIAFYAYPASEDGGDAPNQSVAGIFEIYNKPQCYIGAYKLGNNQPLAGVTFGIYRRDQVTFGPDPEWAAHVNPGQQPAYTMKTGPDGIAKSGKLPYGEYYITEISAPSGYRSQKCPIAGYTDQNYLYGTVAVTDPNQLSGDKLARVDNTSGISGDIEFRVNKILVDESTGKELIFDKDEFKFAVQYKHEGAKKWLDWGTVSSGQTLHRHVSGTKGHYSSVEEFIAENPSYDVRYKEIDIPTYSKSAEDTDADGWKYTTIKMTANGSGASGTGMGAAIATWKNEAKTFKGKLRIKINKTFLGQQLEDAGYSPDQFEFEIKLRNWGTTPTKKDDKGDPTNANVEKGTWYNFLDSGQAHPGQEYEKGVSGFREQADSLDAWIQANHYYVIAIKETKAPEGVRIPNKWYYTEVVMKPDPSDPEGRTAIAYSEVKDGEAPEYTIDNDKMPNYDPGTLNIIKVSQSDQMTGIDGIRFTLTYKDDNGDDEILADAVTSSELYAAGWRGSNSNRSHYENNVHRNRGDVYYSGRWYKKNYSPHGSRTWTFETRNGGKIDLHYADQYLVSGQLYYATLSDGEKEIAFFPGTYTLKEVADTATAKKLKPDETTYGAVVTYNKKTNSAKWEWRTGSGGKNWDMLVSQANGSSDGDDGSSGRFVNDDDANKPKDYTASIHTVAIDGSTLNQAGNTVTDTATIRDVIHFEGFKSDKPVTVVETQLWDATTRQKISINITKPGSVGRADSAANWGSDNSQTRQYTYHWQTFSSNGHGGTTTHDHYRTQSCIQGTWYYGHGDLDVEFTIANPKQYAGHKVYVYETVSGYKQDGGDTVHLGTHDASSYDDYKTGMTETGNIEHTSEDINQEIDFPKIGTSAFDNNSMVHINWDKKEDSMAGSVGTVGSKITVTDTVKYENLRFQNHNQTNIQKVSGSGAVVDDQSKNQFKIKGWIVDKSTGKPYKQPDGQEVRAETDWFTADLANGTVDVVFKDWNAIPLSNKDIVIFEELYVKQGSGTGDEVLIAEHKDLKDQDQTIHFPEIHTTLYQNDVTGINDRSVRMSGADKNRKEFTGNNTDSSMNPTIGKNKKPEETKGSDGTYGGGSATYADAGSRKDDTKEKTSDGKTDTADYITFVDRVQYDNLIPGQEYILVATLMGKETSRSDGKSDAGMKGREKQTENYDNSENFKNGAGTTNGDEETYARTPADQIDSIRKTQDEEDKDNQSRPIVGKYLDENGKETFGKVIGRAKFTPTETSGTQDVTITFDSNYAPGTLIVAFEDLKVAIGNEEHTVATHSDINDKKQSIMTQFATHLFAGGSGSWMFYLVSGSLTALAVLAYYERRRKRRSYKLR